MPPVPPWVFFVAALALRCTLVMWFGQPGPKGSNADENVYLELAWNLFTHGEYGTRVSITYPPLFPMFAAPTFAIESNTLRFATLYGAQALVAGLATLLALPGLSAIVGRGGAWGALAVLQLSSGVLYSARTAQSETLFSALFVASMGAIWSLWDRPTARRAVVAGLIIGLAITTRRTALVLPVAVGILLAWDLVEDGRTAVAGAARRGAGLLVGLGLGLTPELVASTLHGTVIQPYSGGVASGHLGAGLQSFGSLHHLGLAIQVSARQLLYLVVATFGAPLLLGALLLDPRRPSAERPPKGLERAAAFALWSSIGLAAMTALHILRYSFSVGTAKGWDLYPRYLDPAEVPLLLGAFALCAWHQRYGSLATWDRGRVLALVRPWLLGAGVLVLVSGPMARPRGGRLSWVDLAESGPLGRGAAWLFPVFCALTLWAVLGLAASKLRWGRARGLAVAVLWGWLLSPQVPWGWVTVGRASSSLPAVLQAEPVARDPRRPLGVLVPSASAFHRKYYEPAFRSDHPLWFLRPVERDAWVEAYPEGLLLIRKGDPAPPGRPLATTKDWGIWDASESPGAESP